MSSWSFRREVCDIDEHREDARCPQWKTTYVVERSGSRRVVDNPLWITPGLWTTPFAGASEPARNGDSAESSASSKSSAWETGGNAAAPYSPCNAATAPRSMRACSATECRNRGFGDSLTSRPATEFRWTRSGHSVANPSCCDRWNHAVFKSVRQCVPNECCHGIPQTAIPVFHGSVVSPCGRWRAAIRMWRIAAAAPVR